MNPFYRIIGIVFLFITEVAFSQHHNDNWIFSNGAGANFTNGTLTKIPPGTFSSHSKTAVHSSYSDPATGELLLYTDGNNIYNKKHQIMLDGDNLIVIETPLLQYAYRSLIVPFPGQSNLFYVFYVNRVNALTYSLVDINARNGAGQVVQRNQTLSGEYFSPGFIVVSQWNHQGWWLISHKANTDTFYSFRINDTGINQLPVKSKTGFSPYGYGHFKSSNDGESFFFSGNVEFPTSKSFVNAGLYSFDKGCGTISYKRDFVQNINSDTTLSVSVTFGEKDHTLYLSWHTTEGQNTGREKCTLVQYDLSQTDPNLSRNILAATDDVQQELRLAPDNKIYISGIVAISNARLSVINKPDIIGPGCDFQYQAVDFDPMGATYIYYLPVMINDWAFKLKKGNDYPVEIVKKDPCLFNNTSLYLKDSLVADSFVWDLGDGTISHEQKVAHDYPHTGTYPLLLKWYVCGRTYEETDSITISERIYLNLSRDTTVCKGVAHTFYANDTLDEYRWSSGDSIYYTIVSKADMYTLEARKGLCWVKDSAQLKNYPDLWISLGDEYFICDDAKELVKLDAGEGFQSYLWNPTGDTTQWIEVMDLGDYFVVVKDLYGCGGSDGTKVKRRCPVKVYYPNVFTPNGDGLNDNYKPVGVDVISFHMKIYNRWGELIFETNDINRTWDGKRKGLPAPTDVYFYQSSYSGYFNNRINYFEAKGNMSLIR